MPRELKWRLVLAFAALYVIWGSTYLAIRIAVETMPPFSMAAVRFLVAGAVLYAWARRRFTVLTGTSPAAFRIARRMETARAAAW